MPTGNTIIFKSFNNTCSDNLNEIFISLHIIEKTQGIILQDLNILFYMTNLGKVRFN